jgi:DNA-binding GntR family transcriptional regulator
MADERRLFSNGKQRALSSKDEAIRAIKQMIVRNELSAGSNHLESELAERLNMSRTPVREALLVLEEQGLLEVQPRKGARILPLAAEDMSEIYQILTELEGLAAELAASRNHDPKEFAPARSAIREMDEALAKDDREAWAEADTRFHGELIRLSGNSRIAHVVGMFNSQVARARLLTLHLRPSPIKSNEDHRLVLSAIESGDPRAARRLHSRHRVAAGRLIIDILKKHRLHIV